MYELQLLQTHSQFNADLISFGQEICILLVFITDIQYAARIASTKDAVLNIVKHIMDAVIYIDGHLKKNLLGLSTLPVVCSGLDLVVCQ